jgi:hypothetical protein
MKAYKLLRKRKDGSLGPLFINARQRIPNGEWLQAEAHRRKGFAFRPGWHCAVQPEAPHLNLELASGETRVWCEVEIDNFTEYARPANQGGKWLLAERMRLIRELN